MIIISQFTGIYYTFDDSNHYQRSSLYVISYIIPLVLMILNIIGIIQFIKKLSVLQKTSLLLFSFVPLIASVIQLFTYSVSLINITLVGLVVLLYIFSLVDMNNAVDKANQQEIQLLKDGQKKMQLMFQETASALASAIDAKDKYTHGHSSRVAIYSEKIAKLSGKNAEECQDIFFAALLHDVGKIGIPDDVLNKEGKLTDEEFAIIKTHPVIGQQILSSISDSPSLSIGAHHHHERYDGKGYPDGLKGEDIPEIARIISVADAYDAMTSKRSYRDPMPQHVVREEIVKGSGTQFDPEYATAMLHLIDLDTEYDMIEKEESTTVSDSSELVCKQLRSVVSSGVLITDSFSEIIFTGRVIDMDKLTEDSLPTLILFDSLDGNAHDTDYLRKITNYFEYGTIRIDGKCDCPGVRKIKSTVTELDTITPQEYRQDIEKGIRYTIDAVRFEDHVLIRLVTWFKKIELTIAMPDSTRFAYIALTGSNTVMSSIQINRSDTDISADYITRIAEKISYINVPQGDIPNVQIDGWRKAATSGIPVHDGMKITFHTMSLPTARLIWHCPFIDLFYSDDRKIAGENYREFALIRLDGESWEADEKAENKMRYSLTDEFKGWDDWKERNKQGLECTVTFEKDGDTIIVTGELGGVVTRSTTTINDDVNIVYAALTGDQCALTNIRIQ
ncbi:MAG: HD-GYP domain-containing protein [Ruminococcus sp.]|nr:HD-GYP domain-containing protein [Ruminococcus sp.]